MAAVPRCRRTSLARAWAEIRRDSALSIYGALLGAVEVLSVVWLYSVSAPEILGPDKSAICWPFFEDCWAFRPFSAAAWRWLISAPAIFGGLAAGAFLLRRTPVAWWLLGLAELSKLLIIAQDFRLRMNQHYMAFFAILAFLCFPNKRALGRAMIVAFYFFAGLLKLDPEWLSGAAIPVPMLGLEGFWLRAACAEVVLLELVLIFGLYAERAWIFWGTLIHLLIFQLWSWQVVGFFYPLLMLAIDAIVPLSRLLPRPGRAAFARPRRDRAGWALVAGFAALQAVPWLFPGDSAITGEGRLFALHMFDARVDCQARAELYVAGARVDILDLKSTLPVRINCDPLVYLNRGRELCRRIAARPEVPATLSLYLDSRRAQELELRPVLAIEDFCHRALEYDLWRPNAWILRESAPRSAP